MKKVTEANRTFEQVTIRVKANGYEVEFQYPPIIFVAKTFEEIKGLAEQYLIKPVVK